MPLLEGQLSGATGQDDPSPMVRLVTPSGTPFAEGTCRALNCGADGTITFVDGTGTTISNYAVIKGYNPIRARGISVASTTVWALY